jgi:tripartite-type tricarboxylate transporter receptor subunit TctC
VVQTSPTDRRRTREEAALHGCAGKSAGQLAHNQAYGVMAKRRWLAAPNVPIMDEVGVPGLYIPWWQGLWAPKGTGSDVIAKLNGAVVKALIDPTVSRLFSDLGLEIPSDEQRTPGGVRAFHKNDIEKWWPIIKAANIKAE